MNMTNLIAAGLTTTLMTTGFAYAQSAPAPASEIQVMVRNEAMAAMPEVTAMVEELKAEGYTYIEIRRTMLGRAKIIARSATNEREIVMSSSTGEVMRDMMREHQGEMTGGQGGNMGMGQEMEGHMEGEMNNMSDGMDNMDDQMDGMSGGINGGMGSN